MSLHPQTDSKMNIIASSDQHMLQSRAGVRQAMKDLHDMDERLHSNAKRQRLAVENSHLQVNREGYENTSIHPLPIQARSPDKKLKMECVLDKPSKLQDIEAAPMDDDDAKDLAERLDEDAADAEPDGIDESAKRGASRPPAVNSDRLPLPWKGRLGYACLNTYLRAATPPVFSSRTCRIASILQHQHPLADPSLPEHATKNRPDEKKPKDVRLGEKFVQDLGLANARDIVKMLRWNDRYGIKFMRLSSEMFPFASHDKYGYSLAPFASEVLAEAGAVAAELGHRLTTHPGQFTQLGSPRKEVVTAAVRDLAYHDELLSLLKLPEQQDRDAVMILHMGGTFGDKAATLDRFRENYAALPPSVKRRLVLENDDVSWTVHDLLPICEELNIPLVLDYHHHNILFDAEQIREGTEDIIALYPRIRATWTRKNITQKMHYSEQRAGAITPRDRRKHSARVKTLPPCPNDMDLMIEAKDKEQAVFELMRTFKLPGYDRMADIVPHERDDENRPKKAPPKAKGKKGTPKKAKRESGGDAADGVKEEVKEEEGVPAVEVSPEDYSMGGPLGRVYWPEGMEDWLRPKKRTVAKTKNTTIVDEEE